MDTVVPLSAEAKLNLSSEPASVITNTLLALVKYCGEQGICKGREKRPVTIVKVFHN